VVRTPFYISDQRGRTVLGILIRLHHGSLPSKLACAIPVVLPFL
jgi:hypothetical protein